MEIYSLMQMKIIQCKRKIIQYKKELWNTNRKLYNSIKLNLYKWKRLQRLTCHSFVLIWCSVGKLCLDIADKDAVLADLEGLMFNYVRGFLPI